MPTLTARTTLFSPPRGSGFKRIMRTHSKGGCKSIHGAPVLRTNSGISVSMKSLRQERRMVLRPRISMVVSTSTSQINCVVSSDVFANSTYHLQFTVMMHLRSRALFATTYFLSTGSQPRFGSTASKCLTSWMPATLACVAF